MSDKYDVEVYWCCRCLMARRLGVAGMVRENPWRYSADEDRPDAHVDMDNRVEVRCNLCGQTVERWPAGDAAYRLGGKLGLLEMAFERRGR